jgi:hypothetical protein
MVKQKNFKIILIFIYIILLVTPFIDTLTGFLILSGIMHEGSLGSPSQIIRLVILVLSLILSIQNNIKLLQILLIGLYYISLRNYIFFISRKHLWFSY